MSHFDLVVFVYCRDLRGRNIKEYVEETYPPFMQVRQVVMNMKTIVTLKRLEQWRRWT